MQFAEPHDRIRVTTPWLMVCCEACADRCLMGFRDKEIAEFDRHFRSEEESEEIQMFIVSHPRATGAALTLEDKVSGPH